VELYLHHALCCHVVHKNNLAFIVTLSHCRLLVVMCSLLGVAGGGGWRRTNLTENVLLPPDDLNK
jgi:hypothetical protein